MHDQSVKTIHRVTALTLLSALIFYLFFQINKADAFVNSNPFANDPYDAVGSIAFQAALLIGILSYARVLRWRDDPVQKTKARLILHGNILVLASIFITLCTDIVAEIIVPIPGSYWVNFLRLELGLMMLLIMICGAALWFAFHHQTAPKPPQNLTPADAIDDLWSLVRIPVVKAGKFLPARFVAWIDRFESDTLFKHAAWVDPSQYPWRFASMLGLLVGVLLVLVQLQEGLPPSLSVGLLTTIIFISVEFVATLIGFAVLGDYLGLRPAFMKK